MKRNSFNRVSGRSHALDFKPTASSSNPRESLRLCSNYLVACLAFVAAVLLPAGAANAASPKTSTGFFYPLNKSTGYSGWLASGCGSNNDYFSGSYHIGVDPSASLGSRVYAVADGTVKYRSTGGWGDGNIGLAVEHRTSDGAKFMALYGHVHSSLAVGSTVQAGEVIATIGAWPYGNHLHFGVRPGSTMPNSNWGLMPCSSWPDTNGFVDPIKFITSKIPYGACATSLALTLPSGNRANFNASGTDDVGLFVRRPEGGTAIDGFYGRNDARAFVGLTDRWSSASYDPDSIVHTVAGDFNADGRSDLAALITDGGSTSHLDVFLAQSNVTFAAPQTWWRGTSFSAGGVRQMLAGDFDGDGDTDIGTINWSESSSTFRIWLFYSKRSSSDLDGFRPVLGRERIGNYTGSKVLHAAAGDFNGDCRSDIVTLYDYGNNETRAHVWLSETDETLTNAQTWWAGTSYDLNRAAHFTAGDFDDDGDSDLAGMYHYQDTSHTRLHVWRSSGSAFGTSTWLDIPDGDGFFPSRVIALVPGDYDRNTSVDTDLIAVYREKGGDIGFYGFRASSSGSYFTNDGAWATDQPGYRPEVISTGPKSTRLPTDAVSPVTTLSRRAFDPPESSGDWTLGSWEATLACADPMSGCEQTLYQLDDGPISSHVDPITVSTEGAHVLRFRSVDGSDNEEVWRTALLGVDRTAPRSVLEPPTPVVLPGEQMTLRATATDPAAGTPSGASGINSVVFRFCSISDPLFCPHQVSGFFDGTAWTASTDPPTGVWLVGSIADDAAGNDEGSVKEGSVVVAL